MQQLREALPGDQDYRFLLHDRHATFSAQLAGEVESWGIRVLRSPVRTPTANANCERLIGTIRRECLDYLIRLNASHLRRILREWARHYNGGRRPHRSLGPGIPGQVQQTLPAHKQPDPPWPTRSSHCHTNSWWLTSRVSMGRSGMSLRPCYCGPQSSTSYSRAKSPDLNIKDFPDRLKTLHA